MKCSAAVIFSLIFTVILGREIPLNYSKQGAIELCAKAEKKCMSDPATAVEGGSERLNNYFKSSDLTNPPENLDALLLCVFKYLKFQNEEGKIDREKIVSVMGPILGASTIEEYIEKCAVDQETETATARHFFFCSNKISKKME